MRSARGLWRAVRASVLLIVSLSASPLAAQTADSTITPEVSSASGTSLTARSLVLAPEADTTASDTTRTPRRALRRALLVPGLGQVYNRQPEKAPFVVAGLLAAGAYAAYNHDRYLLYRHAFLYRQREDDDEPGNEFERFEEEWIEAGSLAASSVRQLRDNARSSRDIAIVITGAVYALQALDAFVSAELQGFDVSDDLSLHVIPQSSGATVALRLGL